MTYDELTSAQRASLDYYLSLLRPSVGTAAKLLQTIAVVLLANNDDVQAALAALDVDAIIPNKTDLAGAGSLVAAEVQALTAGYQVLVANYGTAELRALHAKTAGVNALL